MHHQDSITRADGHSADGEHPQGQAGAVPWFRHGLPMLVVEGQWVQPKWPAPPSQPRLKLPSSLWRQQLSGLMAAHPEWGHSQECRQQAVTALQQRHVADATKAFGQPGGSQLQQPQARVHQPAAQAGHSVQGPSGRWYHIMQLKPEPQPWCTFCQEHGHCTTACTPFAFSTLLGDDGRDPVTGEKVSSTSTCPPAHLGARASCACGLHNLLGFRGHRTFQVAAREAR